MLFFNDFMYIFHPKSSKIETNVSIPPPPDWFIAVWPTSKDTYIDATYTFGLLQHQKKQNSG